MGKSADIAPSIRVCATCEIPKELEQFPRHASSRSGRRLICALCWNGARREQRRLHWKKRAPASFFRVTSDPYGLFRLGTFDRLDFICSLAGHVWAEGMVLMDEKGARYTVFYDPAPAVARSDGVLLRPDARGMALTECLR